MSDALSIVEHQENELASN